MFLHLDSRLDPRKLYVVGVCMAWWVPPGNVPYYKFVLLVLNVLVTKDSFVECTLEFR